MFDVTGFDVLRGTHSNEEIKEFTDQVEELKQDPSFIMTLIQSFEMDQVKADVFYQKEIITLIQNILKKHWYEEENIYTDDHRIEITNSLINLLVSGYFKSDEQMLFSYTFEFMSQKYFPQNIFVPEMLLEIITQKSENFVLLQYVLIACRSWFKTAGYLYHGRLPGEGRDEELFTNFNAVFDLSQRYLSVFEGLLEECINNFQNGPEYASILVSIFKILSSFLRYTNIPMTKDFFVSILEKFAGFLESTGKQCTEIQEAYLNLVTKANSEFFTKGGSDSFHNKFPDEKREFAEFYNQNAPTFCESILQNVSEIATKTVRISTYYTHLIKQCLQFEVCTETCLNPTIISILIQLCILDSNTMGDAFSNPDYFIKCYLSPFNSKTIRSYAREIVDFIAVYFDASDALVEVLSPNDDDSPEVLDSKGFLLMMANKALLNKQSDDYEALKRRAKRSKKRVPPFRPRLALPEELVSTYAAILSNEIPLYLQCTATYFLAHTLNLSDPESGVELALELIGADDAPPAIVVLASKLFYRCYRVLEEKPEVDSAGLLNAVITVAQDIPTKALKKTVEVLVQGNQDLSGIALEVVEILLELARGCVGAGDEDVSLEDYARSHLSRLLNSVEDIVNQASTDATALAELAPVVYTGALEILATDEDVTSEIEDLLMMLVPFSTDLRVHPAEVFEGAELVLEYLSAEEEARDQIVMSGAPAFVQWLYPLIVEAESPLRAEEFAESVIDMVSWMYEQTIERIDTVDEFQHPYWLIMMAVQAQVFGLREEYVTAAIDAVDRISEFTFNHNEIRVLIAATIRLLATIALLEPEAFAGIAQNENVTTFLAEHCGQRFLVTADEISTGIVALCAAAQCQIGGAFEQAMHLISFYKAKLEEEGKENENKDNKGEGEEEEEENEDVDEIAEAPANSDIDFKTETDNIAELAYPLPLDELNGCVIFEQTAGKEEFAGLVDDETRDALNKCKKLLEAKSQ